MGKSIIKAIGRGIAKAAKPMLKKDSAISAVAAATGTSSSDASSIRKSVNAIGKKSMDAVRAAKTASSAMNQGNYRKAAAHAVTAANHVGAAYAHGKKIVKAVGNNPTVQAATAAA